MRRFWVVVGVVAAAAAVAVGFGVSAAAGRSSAKKPIKIGALTSLTGLFTPWGVQARDGMKLAMSQINAKGGVKGRKLKLYVADDQSSPNSGISGYKLLTQHDHVVSIGGLIDSDVALATARLTEKAHVPMVLIKAGANEILTKKIR